VLQPSVLVRCDIWLDFLVILARRRGVPLEWGQRHVVGRGIAGAPGVVVLASFMGVIQVLVRQVLQAVCGLGGGRGAYTTNNASTIELGNRMLYAQRVQFPEQLASLGKKGREFLSLALFHIWWLAGQYF
jgi:hypothetical protein